MRGWVGRSWLVCCFMVAGIASAAEQSFDSDGVKIHYVVEGEGEPVVFLHGYGANHAVHWRPTRIMETLAKQGFQVMAIDVRGHGKSDRLRDPSKYGVEMPKDVVRLLDHRKIRRAHVVGYSMGSFIGLKLITISPDRIISAVLGGAGWVPPGDKEWALTNQLADSLDSGKGFFPLIDELMAEGAPEERASRRATLNFTLSAMNDVKAMAAVARSFPGLAVSEEELRGNKVPAILFIGDKDPFKTRTVDRMVGVAKNIEIVVIPNGDHITTVANPTYLQGVIRFIEEHRQSPAPTPEKKEPAAAGGK